MLFLFSKILYQFLQINILLLGETGVGKSTFINAFANYFAYESITEAKKSEIKWLIPCSFTMVDEDYEVKKIVLGRDVDDQRKAGDSDTQQCSFYEFPFGRHTIRLIDTPGIADTRGAQQDNWNFNNILEFIGNYQELHCICVLLKPDTSLITVLLEYCFKQLLTHLQKSASKNIVFLFTHARSTYYKPGEIVLPLKRMLEQIKDSPPNVDIGFNKSTVYCVDSEPFRYLSAIKQGKVFIQC